jgi:hypothetical protein
MEIIGIGGLIIIGVVLLAVVVVVVVCCRNNRCGLWAPGSLFA